MEDWGIETAHFTLDQQFFMHGPGEIVSAGSATE
jgi:hypothetical protein